MTQLEAWEDRFQRETPGRIRLLTLAQSDVLRAWRTYRPEPGEPSAPSVTDLAVMVQRDPSTIRRALNAIKRHGLLPE